MNTKNVVKVMNFHSLLRVDKAKKRAQKYLSMEDQLRNMIDMVVNNRNFFLDKNLLKIKEDMPELMIYFGSDFGFCSNYNSQCVEQIKRDKDSYKIVIGKRIFRNNDGTILLSIQREDISKEKDKINEIIREGIKYGRYSKIKVAYNQYVNTSEIKWTVTDIYPLELEGKPNRQSVYTDDFVCESDIDELLINLISTYVNYEIQLIAMNSHASENIMRQNATQESIKRIEEREEENEKVTRKILNRKSFQKIIENYSKFRFRQGE